MKFYIDKLILWLKDGSIRVLKFKEDKVNVITGNSKTGKTAVLEIIDYCFCGSKDTVVISYEHIGENVLWYGLRFIINEKTYTIARGSISKDGNLSDDYYFSQTGEIPDKPYVKMGKSEIKVILENEFNLDDSITVSYGGKSVKKNTRLSYRYFLMFNTLSKDVIVNGKVFFDKLHIERYRDVWPQIFDLSLGVIDFQSIALKNQIDTLKHELQTLESDQKKKDKKILQTQSQKEMLIKRAKEAQIIDESIKTDDAFLLLKDMIEHGASEFSSKFSTKQEFESWQKKRKEKALQLTQLNRFKNSYNAYKKSIKEDADSIQPIVYLKKEFSNRASGEYLQFINILEKELEKIKSAIKGKQPFEFDVERKMRELTKQISEIDVELSKLPHVDYSQIPTAQKLIDFGELKAEYGRIDFSPDKTTDIDNEIKAKEEQLSDLDSKYATVEDRRRLVVETLNEYVQTYIAAAKNALDEYGDYYAWFDYRRQLLTLKKSKSAYIANISSSSDHLFMHLCLFAGMHQMILNTEAPYVPSFLIMDQPSLPYFNNLEYDYSDSENALSIKDDWSKVKNIFSLWNDFFSNVLEQNKHFQVIILEHVSESAWKDCEHIHLVDIFDGIRTALIPPNMK